MRPFLVVLSPVLSSAVQAYLARQIKHFLKYTAYTQDRPARSVSFGYSQDNANQ